MIFNIRLNKKSLSGDERLCNFYKKIYFIWQAISYNDSVAAHHAANLIHHIMAIVSHFVCKTRKLIRKKSKKKAKIFNKFCECF